jgi:hypothetical protein
MHPKATYKDVKDLNSRVQGGGHARDGEDVGVVDGASVDQRRSGLERDGALQTMWLQKSELDFVRTND